MKPTRILLVGAGYVGLYTAMNLQKKLRGPLRRGQVTITLIDPESYMTYQPFLPETAAGNLEPRHVAVPLRRVLKKCELLNGRVTKIEHANKRVTFVSLADEERTVDYDELIVCPGSVVRTLPIPGLADYGIGIKTIGEAVWLRNHVLTQIDIAASTADPEIRKRALTFVVVGGGYAGVETLAELEDVSRDVAADYTRGRTPVHPNELRWVLVEAMDRILPEVGPEMGKRTVKMLRKRGIDIKLETRLESAEGNIIKLSDGSEFPTNTLIWTAGVKANPLLLDSDLPLDERKRVMCDATLRVAGVEGAWAAGDCAAVPDLTEANGPTCAPSAQHAIRQAKQLAANIAAHLKGKKIRDYRHKYAGSVAGLGLHHGAAQVYGVKLAGFPAWMLHRLYHVAFVPTFNRKVRVLTDWMLSFFFKRETVALGEIHEPREEFIRAAGHMPPAPPVATNAGAANSAAGTNGTSQKATEAPPEPVAGATKG